MTAFILSVFAVGAVAGNDEVYEFPIYDTDRAPLSTMKDGELTGMYPEIIGSIMKEADLKFKYVPLPTMRRRIGFEEGRFLLSCCANPHWYNRPKEEAVQLFSDAVFLTRDYFVFPKERAFSIVDMSELSDKVVVTKLGFEYFGAEWFGTRLNVGDENSIMRLVSSGRGDVGIVNERILNLSPLKGKVAPGPIHSQFSLHFRVHRSRPEMLPSINGAIGRLKEKGVLADILARYGATE